MKDSGVEWLGEIPAHWEVKRLKDTTSKIGSGMTPSGGEVYVSDGVMLPERAFRSTAAFISSYTEGGDLLIGVADDGSIVGIERDQLESDDKFMRHLAQVVRNGLGDRAGTCIDPKTQIVQGKTVCVVSCQRSPEPVFLKWKGVEAAPDGDLFVRSGPGTVKLTPASAREYIRTRFPGFKRDGES